MRSLRMAGRLVHSLRQSIGTYVALLRLTYVALLRLQTLSAELRSTTIFTTSL